MSASNKAFWDKTAKNYDFIMKKDKRAYEIIIKKIKQSLNYDYSVLELATGTGIISLQIANCVKNIEATDFSENMIHIAKTKPSPSSLKFTVEDACNLPYKDKSFDCIIISNALHVIPYPEKTLENIFRVLKDDGVLIAPTFLDTKNVLLRLLSKIMSIKGFQSYHKWRLNEYIDFIEHNNFKVTQSDCIKVSTFPLAYVEAKKIL